MSAKLRAFGMPGCRRIFKRDILCVPLCKCLCPQSHSFARLLRDLVDHKTDLKKCYLHRQGETLLCLTMVCKGRPLRACHWHQWNTSENGKTSWGSDILSVGIASQTCGECAIDIIQGTSPYQYYAGSSQEANLAPTTLWGRHYHASAEKELKNTESEQWTLSDRMTVL